MSQVLYITEKKRIIAVNNQQLYAFSFLSKKMPLSFGDDFGMLQACGHKHRSKTVLQMYSNNI